MKASELRDMSREELLSKEEELYQALFNLRFQHATGQLDNPMMLKKTKRDLARVKTVIREKELKA